MSGIKKKCFKSLDNRVREEMNKTESHQVRLHRTKGSWAVPWRREAGRVFHMDIGRENVAWELNIRQECTRQETEFPVLCRMEVQCGKY